MFERLRERAFDRFFGDIHTRRLEALREASSRQSEDEGWRRLTDHDRDLSPVTHDRQREIAVYLWTYNPIARRILESTVEWVVGEGVQIQATHDRTQAYLEQHWKDRMNRWELRLPERVRELYLMGEQFWPAFQNEYSGILRLGTLDPSRVKEVVPDPDNASVLIGLITKSRAGEPERRFRTVLASDWEDVLSAAALRERESFGDGELFAFAVNKLSTATRGISDLFALADWLDGYEQLLFSILQQERVRAQHLWDVTLTGMDEKQIAAWLSQQSPPKPLTIRAHNEKVKWEMVGPEFGSGTNNAETARLFRNHVLGGGNIPEHWYGGGGDVNRAAAAEMGAPTEKGFTAKQRAIRAILEDVCAVQVERGIAAGVLPDEDEVREVTVTMPDLSPRDLARVGPALQQVAAALVLGKGEGWVDDETAARVLTSLISHLGVEADADEMLERARAGLADQVAREYGRQPGAEAGAA